MDPVVSPSRPSLPVRKRKWGHKTELLMTCISCSVGLGNLWRFPYICYAYGGGAFLIPYIIITLLVGRPLFHLDLVVGQYSGVGPLLLYNSLGKGWTGLAISQSICCFSVLSYYAYIIGVVLMYVGLSCHLTLPWTKCEKKWGPNCVGANSKIISNKSITSAELYFNKVILEKIDSIENGLGYPNWKLVIAVGIVWSLSCICVLYGIKSSGKIAYFTAIFPYVILLILLIRVTTLRGAVNGLVYLFKPEWKKLLNINVWIAATSQSFFSLGVGYGIITMYASYNSFDENINIVSLTIAIVDTVTSIIGCIVCFSSMGFLAKEMGVEVKQVLTGGGMKLAFVSYATAVAKFSFSYVFSFTFFLMLATLGIGSLNGYIQVITTNIMERYQSLKEWQVAIAVSIFGFLSSIIYTTPGGELVLDMIDTYGNTYVIGLLALFQIIAFIYVYGMKNLAWDIRFMTHKNIGYYWKWCWILFTPLILFSMYILTYIYGEKVTYHGKPVQSYIQYICIGILSFFSLPVIFVKIYYFCLYRKQGCKQAARLTYHSEDWLPVDETLAAQMSEYRKYRNEHCKYNTKTHLAQTFICLAHDV